MFILSLLTLYGLSHPDSLTSILSDRGSLSYSQKSSYQSLLIVLEIFTGLTIIAMLQLISFHSYLAFKHQTTYEFILERRKSKNKYKVSTIKVINENEAIEEVPLEEVFEPYMQNPQFEEKEKEGVGAYESVRIAPDKYILPPISDSEESVKQPHSA